MAQVRIKTLTPVHIGSGRDLMKNTEFLISGDEVGIVDDRKVVDVIGIENVDKWVSIINNGESLLNYLNKRKSGVTLSDVSNRVMIVYSSDILQKQSLKEQLHSAKLLPMIPGSSIKGAIRTAVIAKLVNVNTNKVAKIIKNSFGVNKAERLRSFDFQKVETTILNNLLSGSNKMDANKNTFRFLQVTDAVFNSNTIVSNMQVANFHSRGWGIKKGTDQLVEMIDVESESNIRIKIDDLLLKRNIEKHEIKSNTSFLESTESLFKIINEHTRSLVKKEIDFWTEEDINEEKIETYIENLNTIYENINKCKDNEAILRIGGNTGWESITGSWIKHNKELLEFEEWEQLYKLLNKNRDVDIFPKTRKIDEDGFMTGFVELSII